MVIAKCVNVIEPFFNKPYSGLELNREYEVKSVSMGSCLTYITLENGNAYNSICFDFFENGQPLDIYSDKRFNHYLR